MKLTVKFDILSNKEVNSFIIELENDNVFLDESFIKIIRGFIKPETSTISQQLLVNTLGKKFNKTLFCGSGKIYSMPTICSLSCIDLENGKSLLLKPQSLVAAEKNVTITIDKKLSIQKFLTGKLLGNLRLDGQGKIILISKGPVEIIKLNNSKLEEYDRSVIAYSPDLTFSTRISGVPKRTINVYAGTGTIIFSRTMNRF